jgi:hypothetical protein
MRCVTAEVGMRGIAVRRTLKLVICLVACSFLLTLVPAGPSQAVMRDPGPGAYLTRTAAYGCLLRAAQTRRWPIGLCRSRTNAAMLLRIG